MHGNEKQKLETTNSKNNVIKEDNLVFTLKSIISMHHEITSLRMEIDEIFNSSNLKNSNLWNYNFIKLQFIHTKKWKFSLLKIKLKKNYNSSLLNTPLGVEQSEALEIRIQPFYNLGACEVQLY